MMLLLNVVEFMMYVREERLGIWKWI